MNNRELQELAFFHNLLRQARTTQHFGTNPFQYQYTPQTESDTQRLLRETLNAPSPYKYVLDPEYLEKVITHIKYNANTTNITNPSSNVSTIETYCPITMDDFTEGETISQLQCGHIFKPDAINNWLLTEKAECPVCRYKLPSIEVRNQDEKEFINHLENSNNISHNQNQHQFQPQIQQQIQERDNIDRNIIAFVNSLQSLSNLGQF